jgi:hypothetical protein
MTAERRHHDHPEVLPEASGPGTVVLDIGGDIGAAAVEVPETLAGHEIEIRRDGAHWSGEHVAVRERPLGTGKVWVALFPSLRAGRYDVRIKADATSDLGGFQVSGGQVTSYSCDAQLVH